MLRHLKTLLVLLVLASLAACHSPARQPEPVIVTKEVLVPVPVKCEADIPPEPKETVLDTQGDLYDRGKALLIDNKALRDYVKILLAKFKGCT